MWEERWDWDKRLDVQKQSNWTEILKDLKAIPDHSIPRYLGFLEEGERFADLTLVCFFDASIKAYATVIYLHHSSQDKCKADLIFSKTRLASDKITIPRLELLGVLIGVYALKFVEKELHLTVTSKILWTDSQCVLHWMQTTKPLPVFISNRLKEIHTSQGIRFKYVKTKDNPADIATRGQSPEELSSIWWKGPQWLQQHKDHWPEGNIPPETNLRFDAELETNTTSFAHELIVGKGLHWRNKRTHQPLLQ